MFILDIINCVVIVISCFLKLIFFIVCLINIFMVMYFENFWENRILVFFKYGWFICIIKYMIEFEFIWSLKIIVCLNFFDMISRRLWMGNSEELFFLKFNVRKYFLVIVKSVWYVLLWRYFLGW